MGGIDRGRWEVWQEGCRMGATSLLNVTVAGCDGLLESARSAPACVMPATDTAKRIERPTRIVPSKKGAGFLWRGGFTTTCPAVYTCYSPFGGATQKTTA